MGVSAKAAESTIGISKDVISYVAGRLQMTYAETLILITTILQDTLDWTIIDVEGWITEFVPKRTGQLQNNLILNLHSSFIKNKTMIRLVLKTFIDYAGDVDAYSDAQVQHNATWFEHSGERAYAYYGGHHGAIFLDDPEAVGGFMSKLQEFAKGRALFNLTKAQMKFMGGRFGGKYQTAFEQMSGM